MRHPLHHLTELTHDRTYSANSEPQIKAQDHTFFPQIFPSLPLSRNIVGMIEHDVQKYATNPIASFSLELCQNRPRLDCELLRWEMSSPA